MLQVKTSYTPLGSKLETERAELKIGGNEGEFFPYDLLLGSLSSCFYYTLYDVLTKSKNEVPSMEIIVTGDKRTEAPTTLEWTHMDITVFDEVDQKRFLRAVELAAKYCSIHETISKVAKMSHEVIFNPYQ